MGLGYVKLRVRKNAEASESVEIEFLVDSGAFYTVVPGTILRQLGVRDEEEHSFFLANGEQITRKTGEAHFEYGGKHGTSKVIFGEPGDSNLLGALTLEALGFALDPLRRELKPLPMLLM